MPPHETALRAHHQDPLAPAMEPVLALERVTKRWPGAPAPVLEEVDLELAPGSATRLTGGNGVGKTTLLRIAAGLIAPDQGEVGSGGSDPWRRRREFQARVSYMPAGSVGLYARLTPRMHLEYQAGLSLLPRRARGAAVERELRRFALAPIARRRTDRLSMGQRQRVRLAMAMLPGPRVVLLDEPLTSLDDEAAELLDGRARRAAGGWRGRALVLSAGGRPGDPGGSQAGVARGARVERVSAGAYASAAGAVLRRDLRLYLSYPGRFPMRVLTAVFSLALFHYISQLVAVDQFSDPEDYFAFVVVGLVILEVLQATLGVGVALRQELLTGNFERVVLSPFGPVPGIAAMALLPLLLAFVLALVMLGAGALLFDLPVSWSQAPLAVPVALLGSSAFAALGLLFAAVVVLFKQATSAAAFFVAIISLLSGVYFPVALLPGWAEWLSGVLPFKPTVDLLRHLLLDTPMVGSVGAALAKLAGFVAVLTPLSLLALRAALRHTQRRGTIAEY